jgi:murein L,D-transpeptidase YcbB/YkuD
VKFVVPDPRCIALHGTPHGRLFGLPNRERSHGCIRLEDPDALARWVLSREPGWDEARIAEVVGRDRSTTVRLREPVSVVIVYGTASVDPDGTEHFVDDAYHLDAQAEAELARHRTGG